MACAVLLQGVSRFFLFIFFSLPYPKIDCALLITQSILHYPIVDYFYDTVNGVYTCTSEQSRTYDANGDKVDERKTIHDHLTPSQQL